MIMSDASSLSTRGPWTKASASRSNGACIEIAVLTNGHVAVRDSKNPNGPALTMSPTDFRAFASTAGRRGGALRST